MSEPENDVWVATTSGTGEPCLVPLSFAWVDERIVLVTARRNRTARNIAATGAAHLVLGPTRDVVSLEARPSSSSQARSPRRTRIAIAHRQVGIRDRWTRWSGSSSGRVAFRFGAKSTSSRNAPSWKTDAGSSETCGASPTSSTDTPRKR